MTEDYKGGRQTVFLSMSDDEFNARFAAIEDAFGSDWLKSGDHPLQTMFCGHPCRNC